MAGPGLTATELSAVVGELTTVIVGAEIRDLARLDGKDDLLLFLDHPAGRRALHIVTGGPRARICTTRRRYRRAEFGTGPLVDRLRQTLMGCRVGGVEQPQGERRCSLHLVAGDDSPLTLEVELFGARGLWCITDVDHRIRELSRLPDSAGRTLRPGAVYIPPPPRTKPADTGGRAEEPPPRFVAPVLEAVDSWFTRLDQEGEVEGLRRKLASAIERGTRKLTHKLDGLTRQREQIERVPEIRREADLLLAYGFAAPPGAASIRVPDPVDPDRTLTLALEPGKPIQLQADKLYKKARKLQDSVEVSARRAAEAEAALEPLLACQARLDQCEDTEALLDLQQHLVSLGVVSGPKVATVARLSNRDRNLKKITKGYNFRHFTTGEGHLVLAGRTNQENDRLSIAVARGNDLWFHVGQGYAGSHVVMRLPKDKSASLESLLDAATLAIYFSKARNASRCEVIYTLAKNVRKPKGLPPGKVTTTSTKTLLVQVEPDRLRRMLDSAEAN